MNDLSTNIMAYICHRHNDEVFGLAREALSGALGDKKRAVEYLASALEGVYEIEWEEIAKVFISRV